MPAPKKLSIIIAVFNGEATLQKTLDSIRAQKTPEVELLVIDGQSTDGTMAILQRNADVIDYSVSERDTGIYNAWNKGLKAATGEWFAFVGADDWYAPDGLTAYLKAIARADDDTELITSRVRYHPLWGAPKVIGQAWSWPAFQRLMTVAHVGAIHHRRLYARLGNYDESYRICADYELLLRARASLKAEYFPVITTEMGGGGISGNQLARTFSEASRAKHYAGGRSLWRCQMESVWDHLRIRIKRRLLSMAGRLRSQALAPLVICL